MRTLIEKIGEHPFITGLLAIVGLAGFLLSVVGYGVDRQEASQTSQQVEEGFDQTNRSLESGLAETNRQIADTQNALRSVDANIKSEARSRQGSYQDGTFLYEDPVEGVYSNFWTAYLIRNDPSPTLTILGEGKTVDFSGTVTLNCSNYRYSWKNGANFQEAIAKEEIEELVPEQAMRATTRIFCWDRK